MSTHTKGPWTRDKWGEHDGYDAIYGGICITAGPERYSLIVVDGAHYNERNGEQTHEDRQRMEADARLIAAAPDLYEMAAYAVDNPNFNSAEFDRMARAAIAKARGDQ